MKKIQRQACYANGKCVQSSDVDTVDVYTLSNNTHVVLVPTFSAYGGYDVRKEESFDNLSDALAYAKELSYYVEDVYHATCFNGYAGLRKAVKLWQRITRKGETLDLRDAFRAHYEKRNMPLIANAILSGVLTN